MRNMCTGTVGYVPYLLYLVPEEDHWQALAIRKREVVIQLLLPLLNSDLRTSVLVF